MTKRIVFKFSAYVVLMLRDGDKILVLKRSNTGFDDDRYAFPGGQLDGNERIFDAVIREAREELGITLKTEDLKLVHTRHVRRDSIESIGFFIEARAWSGQIQNMEPHKHALVEWVSINRLPYTILQSDKMVLDFVERRIAFSDWGFDNNKLS